MKKMKDIKLRVKLIAMGLVAGLLPMIIVGVIAVRTSSEALLKSGREFTFQAAQDLYQTSSLFLSQEMTFARAMAMNDAVVRVAEVQGEIPQEALADLNTYFTTHMKRLGGDYDLFFVTDAQGAIQADSMSGALKKKGVNVGDRDYFKAARKGKVVVGDAIQSRATGKAVFVVAVPLTHSGGGFNGVLASVIRLDTLSAKLTQVKIGETGYAFLSNAKGIIIAHPNEELVFKLDMSQVKVMEAVVKMMKAKVSGVKRYEYKGVEKLAGFVHIPLSGWTVGVTINRAEILAPVRRLISYSLTAGGAALLILGLFSFMTARRITAPINHTAAGLRDISQGDGDLTQRLPESGRDEVGSLARGFNGFVDQLHAMISDISQSVTTLSASSGQLDSISREMSAGVEQSTEKAGVVAAASQEMTSDMDTVSASMTQSSANIGTVAGAAEEMNATIGEIAKSAEEARAISETAVAEVGNSTGKMTELGDAAQSIGQVVETITDISEQVNLLSLNATIEAARAGEAGRGFAVVANEIKDLAQQTSTASMDIKTKVDHIQNCSQVSQDGMTAVSRVMNQVNEIVAGIAAAVEQQSAAVREITENISQASIGLQAVTETVNGSSQAARDISSDIAQVNQASRDMADQTRQVLDSSGDLSRLAEQLNGMVGRFKI